jgi:hypothetical protein
VATPLAFKEADPSVVDPLTNVTVPVGTGAVDVVPMTVATSTAEEEEPPDPEAPRLVLVGMSWTTCETVFELLAT